MHVQPPAKKGGDTALFNPYEAADEVAKIPVSMNEVKSCLI